MKASQIKFTHRLHYLRLFFFLALVGLLCAPADWIKISVRARSQVNRQAEQTQRPISEQKAANASQGLTVDATSQLRPLAPPANDQCAGAEVIPAAGPFPYSTATTDTTDATSTGDPLAPSCLTGGFFLLRSVWYVWTPSVSAQYIIATCNPPTSTTVSDTMMGIYTASGACSGFSQFQCNDDTLGCGTDFQSKVTENFVAGTTYYIVIWELATSPSQPPTTGNTDVQLVVAKVTPTATESSITGTVVDAQGAPLAGVTMLLEGGSDQRRAITDSNGHYSLGRLETGDFYVVSPAFTNYTFSPANRSFSLRGQQTEASFTATRDAVAVANPLDTPEYFVRQHYLDFLNREPDENGFNFWSDGILACGNDLSCVEVSRINTSAAYFLSIEFQQTGYEVYRMYKAAYGDLPGAPVPVRFNEFLSDTREIGQKVIVNQSGWQQELEKNKQAFANEFVSRSRFTNLFGAMSAPQFVDVLNQNAGSVLSSQERDELVTALTSGAMTRAQVLRSVAENSRLQQQELNRAFVLMEYFGYLRRDPNAGPDTDFSGYNFWLSKLNHFDGNFEQAEMVKAFLNSGEYRGRFGP
jgi:hypothetical protein